MKEILSQKIKYAEIVPYKNYSKISDRTNYLKNVERLDTPIELEFGSDVIKMIGAGYEFGHIQKSKVCRDIMLKPKRKNKKTKYFHNNTETEIPISIDYCNQNITHHNPYITTKDRHIKKHYGNPFSEILIHTIDRSIRIKDNKLTIKLYKGIKRRDLNWIYFRKSFTVTSITIDLSTGNFTTSEITNTSKRFRKNSFTSLNGIVMSNQIFGITESYLLRFNDKVTHNKPLLIEINEIFSEEKFSSSINSVLGFNFTNYHKDKRVFLKLFIDKFVELKKIKVPDNFQYLIKKYYPTEKYLKKNDRKLIASILDFFGIKSKITIRILHHYPNIDIFVLYNLCKLFGKDFHKYIGNIDIKVISNMYEPSKYTIEESFAKEMILNNPTNITINDVDRDTLLKLINSLVNNKFSLDKNFINLILDHFKMIEKVREHGVDYEFKAKDYNQLHTEHSELSKIVGAIKKGWVLEYKFNEEMVKEIEKPITVSINLWDTENTVYEYITFKPHILKREEEYVEEGNFMHHCVASYSDKDRSIIISIRNEDMSDRVTCEFDCQTGLCIQARHFCNGQPPDYMVLALDELKEKVKLYARMGMLHSTEKIKVPLMINGKEIKPELPTPTFRDYLFIEGPDF